MRKVRICKRGYKWVGLVGYELVVTGTWDYVVRYLSELLERGYGFGV